MLRAIMQGSQEKVSIRGGKMCSPLGKPEESGDRMQYRRGGEEVIRVEAKARWSLYQKNDPGASSHSPIQNLQDPGGGNAHSHPADP